MVAGAETMGSIVRRGRRLAVAARKISGYANDRPENRRPAKTGASCDKQFILELNFL